MATTVLAFRPRSRGTEISFDVDGTERVLWRRGWFGTDDTDAIAWATPRMAAIAAAEAAAAQEDADEDAATQAAAFRTWIRDNRTRPEVRQLLRPLARMWREETS